MIDILKGNYEYEEDKYNKEYMGYVFDIGGKKVFYREGRVTDKYDGIFVTLWKKIEGVNSPYLESDEIDYLLIKDSMEDSYYLFDKEILSDLKILTTSKAKGKMGFRLFSNNNSKNKKYISYLYNKDEIRKKLEAL